MTEPLTNAILMATKAHGDQRSEDGTLYILHPLAVMLMGTNDTERIVGVLHDVVEDTHVPITAVRGLFGDTIAQAVDAMTHRPGESYEDFIERCRYNHIARKVKVYDITHNLSRPPVRNPERQKCLTARYTAALRRLV